jgi:hypothetical protein
MAAHLTLKEHYNRCRKKARAAAARLRSLTRPYGVVPPCVTAVQIASIPPIALHGSDLWSDPCSSPFTEAVPLRRDRSIRGVPPSVNGLVHSLSVPHLGEWTGSFTECTHFVNTLHSYMRTHVCTLGWPYPVEFNQRN